MNVFVFRPGANPGPAPNVFGEWEDVMDAMSKAEGRKFLEFDDSLGPCAIPDGLWPMKDVMWAGFGPRPGAPRTTVSILSGAQFSDLRMIGGQITVVGKVFAAEGGVPPIRDLKAPDQVHIGIRDDGGTSQFANQGDVPLFEIEDQSVFFFIQNCIFGVEALGITSTSPLIRFKVNTEAGKRLTLNLLGQNQTGPNVVVTEGVGATVLFGALSSSAQVAFDQTSISNDGYQFGPLGRIQRQVIPRPPDPPATKSVLFNKPIVLVRCDGRVAFTQELPSISKGFTIGNSGVALYTGGQEVVISEVAGGNGLKVRPATGDTIDGDTGEVRIRGHASKTFASDGVNNWITISEVRK